MVSKLDIVVTSEETRHLEIGSLEHPDTEVLPHLSIKSYTLPPDP